MDKGFPELFDDAREQLALQSYLQQLDHPQIAFSVKQKCPATLDEAVAATLEMESYLSPHAKYAVGGDSSHRRHSRSVNQLDRAVGRKSQ